MKDYQEQLETLQKWIDESKNIVFFGGAGVSTESGIPDFRSVDGLYNQQYKYPPETILSRSFFDRDPEEFYRFYRNKMLCLTAKPNAAHKKLAQLEAAGKLKSIVTQNIDGLHQAARKQAGVGAPRKRAAKPLHGLRPGLPGLRHRRQPGGATVQLRRYHQARRSPLRGEPQLPGAPGALSDIQQADMLIIGGTSLVVYPAAGLVNYYQGHRLVLINKSTTPYDKNADLVLSGPIGEILDQIKV